MSSILSDIGIIIILATAAGYIAKFFRQPLIPAYIITGLILGPILGIVTNMEVVFTLSELGIAFLLFIVGLEINFKKIRDVGAVSVFGGTIQILILFIIGLLLAFALKYNSIQAVYVALMVSFSSTMVVVKILSDNREVESLHGRIIIGILLLQDLFAVFSLAILATLDGFSFAILIVAILKGIIFIAVSLLITLYLLPPIFKFAAKSQELLFLVSLSTCFIFALFATQIGIILAKFFSIEIFGLNASITQSLQPGFSIAIGGFFAGIGLANLPYNYEIIGKVKSLRDFFSTIFFVSLGLELSIVSINLLIIPLIVLSIFVILIKPIIMMLIVTIFGYTSRIGFLSSNALAQLSEFSLIIVAQGLILGHVSDNLFALTIILTIITISTTSYSMNYQEEIYKVLSKRLKFMFKFFEGLTPTKKMEYIPKKEKVDVILCGYNRIGYTVSKALKKLKMKTLIIDFNPEVIKELADKKYHCIYGDIGDQEILERLPLKDCKMVISTVSNQGNNILLIKELRKQNNNSPIIVTSQDTNNALKLYNAGADYVILPHFLGGEHISLLLEDFTRDLNKFLLNKIKHIKELRHRTRLGHHHPSNRL